MVIQARDFVNERIPSIGGSDLVTTLTLDAVYRQRDPALVGTDGVLRGERSEVVSYTRQELQKQGRETVDTLVEAHGHDQYSKTEFFHLSGPETFVAEFAESPQVPDGWIGLVFPHPSLPRAGFSLDAGPVPGGLPVREGVIELNERVLILAEGAPVAQLVGVPATTEAFEAATGRAADDGGRSGRGTAETAGARGGDPFQYGNGETADED